MNHPKILSRYQAEKAVIESLFKPDRFGTITLKERSRFDTGKYISTVIGNPVPPHMIDKVRIVWAERRKDKDGVYYALFCVAVRGGPADRISQNRTN